MNYFPNIPPIENNQPRPFWSVMIPTYNSDHFLEETLKSILAHDPGIDRMQIEIVDDSSVGEPALETLKKMDLTARVNYFRQKENVGLSRNWNTCVQRSRGEVVHILHQDDYVLPGFYQEMEKGFQNNPSIGAAICRCQIQFQEVNIIKPYDILQTEEGILADWLERISSKNRLMTPSICVRRAVYETIGGFHPDLIFAVDWEMWIRIANYYPVWYTPKILATYRNHQNSETKRLSINANTIRDINLTFSIRNLYLAENVNIRTEKKARQHYAEFAFRHAIRFFDKHQWGEGFIQIREGLHISHDVQTVQVLMGKLSRYFFARIQYRFGLRKKPVSHKNF